jgi:hypothetical protein
MGERRAQLMEEMTWPEVRTAAAAREQARVAGDQGSRSGERDVGLSGPGPGRTVTSCFAIGPAFSPPWQQSP